MSQIIVIVTMSQTWQEVPLSLMKTHHCIQLRKSPCLYAIAFYLHQNQILIQEAQKETRDKAVSPKKRNLITQRKRKISSPSPLKSNSNTPEKSRIQQISGSIRVLPPSNTETRRVYNKRNYCPFCLHPSLKISRHLEAVHRNEVEVALAFQLPNNSKERRKKLDILRRRRNFAHNANVVREGAGELQACYTLDHESVDMPLNLFIVFIVKVFMPRKHCGST